MWRSSYSRDRLFSPNLSFTGQTNRTLITGCTLLSRSLLCELYIPVLQSLNTTPLSRSLNTSLDTQWQPQNTSFHALAGDRPHPPGQSLTGSENSAAIARSRCNSRASFMSAMLPRKSFSNAPTTEQETLH